MTRVRLADPPRDNAALCELARLCPQGRRLRFYHHRTDYRERGRLHSDTDVLVIDHGNIPIAAVSLARKRLRIGNDLHDATYIFDLMVHPAHRGRGLGRELIRAARGASPRSRLFYCHILGDNDASRSLFTAEGFTAHPHRLLYHVLLPRFARRWSPISFVRDANDGVFSSNLSAGTANAALRRHEPQVFIGLPWYADLLGCVIPIFPRTGRPVRAWSLHHLAMTGSRPEMAMRRLLGGVARLADREKVDAIAIPLFENDPHTATIAPLTLTGWGVAPGVTWLYVSGELASRVVRSPRPLVLNPEDA